MGWGAADPRRGCGGVWGLYELGGREKERDKKVTAPVISYGVYQFVKTLIRL